MKRRIALFMVLAVISSICVFAAQYHSVPIGHEAYRIIEVGELRGIIPVQADVKPFNLNAVRDLLYRIEGSNLTTAEEKAEIGRILAQFDSLYGSEPSESISEMVGNGFYRTSNEKATTTIGTTFESIQKAGYATAHDVVFDSGNILKLYANGDLSSFISYDINALIGVMKPDIYTGLLTDFQFQTDCWLVQNLKHGKRLLSLPDDEGGIYTSVMQRSEISASIKDDLATLRIGEVNRDWGLGTNGFEIAGSARPFTGFDIAVKPASWFFYAFTVGSLGNTSLDSIDGIKWPSESLDRKDGEYYNNITTHRVELGPFSGAKLAAWESVIWRKRFELSYLNPLSILMFSQNELGDYDNVLAGFDLSYTIPKVGMVYGSFAMDELTGLPLSSPRNMIALQAGIKLDLPIFAFSELTLQLTQVSAFFGAHYSSKEALFGDINYKVPYVNKGQNLSYPLFPDSIELLMNFSTTIGSGWHLSATVKDQMRSAQYAINSNGTDILTAMSYEGYDWAGYENRDFFHNIWNNALDVQLNAEKRVASLPVTLVLGLEGIAESKRSFVPQSRSFQRWNEDHTALINDYYYPGIIASWGEWETNFTVTATVGVKLYY